MKKYYIYLAISVFALMSCEDFLNVAPETSQTPVNFYQNQQQIDEAVAAVYSENRDLINNVHWRFGENRSDNTSFQYNPTDRGGQPNEAIDEFVMDAANGRIADYWNISYSGISRANFILTNIEGVDFGNPDIKSYRKGEILFLRTWFYFNLVQLFGDIPFITSSGTSPDIILTDEFLTRVPASQVYGNLFTDIQEAIDLLPGINEAESGRATTGAAMMLKAKMHMASQDFNAAIPLLESIQSMGYALQADYASVFDPANKNNSESIFELQYSFALGQGSNFVSRFVPFNSGNDILGASGPAGSRAGQNQPTQDLIDLYDTLDTRYLHNISFYDDGSIVEPWMSKYDFGFVDIGIQEVNFPMFRYADALLMLAECYNEVGGGDPVTLIEQVRTRALSDPSLTAEEQNDLTQTIADERRRELAFENHRWFDLVRTGKAVEVMTAHGQEQKTEKVTVTSDAYTNIRTLLGVPLREVEEFGFTQNSGW